MHINSIFALLTKCEIKTAFFCVFMDQDKVKVSKKCKKKKKRTRQKSNHLDQRSMVSRGFINMHGQKNLFACGTYAENPEHTW